MDEIKGTPGIVGLFGHNTIAGFISADTMFGDPMLRIDVPETTKFPAFTRHYGVKAVYEIDWCSEELMRAAAENAQVRPIAVYIPQLVSREAHDKAVDELREEIERLRGGLLAPGDPSDDIIRHAYLGGRLRGGLLAPGDPSTDPTKLDEWEEGLIDDGDEDEE